MGFSHVKINLNQSLQDLENKNWGDPTEAATPLISECLRLRRIPLKDFTIENLRRTIGQDIGLEYLIPLALEQLELNPFVEGICYPCDLLVNVLSANKQFWQTHPELAKRVIQVHQRAISLFPTMPDIACEIVINAVTEAHKKFQRSQR